MSRPIQMKFLGATDRVDRLPETQAEVVFIGRSNVGKSLLNAICGKVLAPMSKAPGRTKTLSCFALDRSKSTLVDCPGYGYAKVSKATRQQWLPMIERYLLEREELVMVLLLVDGEIGPTASDLEMLDWLREQELPHTVVATKLDKVKSSKRHARKQEFSTRCELPPEDALWVSTTKETGIVELRERIRTWLA